MIIRESDHVFLAKIIFEDITEFLDCDENDYLNLFKNMFSDIFDKYNISGNILVDFYIDNSKGIIIKINNYFNCNGFVNTRIIFHFDCVFLINVEYFNVCDKCDYLYYYNNEFYSDILVNDYIDGNIIYDSDEILKNGIKFFIRR